MELLDQHTPEIAGQASCMQELNACCLYLKVITVADICTPDGIHIDPSMLLGEPSKILSQSNRRWPLQQKPSRPSWTCWKRMLLTILGHCMPTQDKRFYHPY